MSSREQFEAWLKSEGYAPHRSEWQVWQAATSDLEAKCTALAAELKQSQIDAGCYRKGMEASNERLVQVAAENAGLKQSTPDLQTMMTALDVFFADDEVPERAMLAAYNVLRAAVKTPATDSFLAEVRASAITYALNESSEYLDTDCVMDRLDISYYDAGLRTAGADELQGSLVSFAAQLRKGAAE